MSDQYRFNIQNKQVVGILEWDDGHWEQEKIDVERESIFNHSFEINDNLITELEPERSGFEKTVYQDINNDGQYQKLSEEFVRDNHDSDGQWTNPFEPLNTEDQEETVLILNTHQQDSVRFNVGDDLKNFNFNTSEGDQINLSQEFGISNAEEFVQRIEDIEHDGHTLEVDLGQLGEIEIVGITSENITWDIVNFSS